MGIINELGILEASKKREEERNQAQKAYKDNLCQMLDNCLKHLEQAKNILATCDFMAEHGLNGQIPFITMGNNYNHFISCKNDKLNYHHFTNIKFQREYDGVIASTELIVMFNPFEKSLTIDCSGLVNDCIKLVKIHNDYHFEKFSTYAYLRIFDHDKMYDIENFTKNLKQYLNLMVDQINKIN